jgi:hypothetical protein
MDLRHNSGAVLPIVLLFAVFAAIVTVMYIAGQYTIARPFLGGAASFQALCTARSGIWKGMQIMSQPAPDTLSGINTLDTMFNKKLFGDQTQAMTSDPSSGLVPGDSPTVVSPFSSDSFGEASLSLSCTPGFKVLTSKGTFHSSKKSVRAFFGGRLYTTPDTVCILMTAGKPEGGGVIDGKMAFPAPAAPVGDSGVKAGGLRMKELIALVAYYRTLLSEESDTMMLKAPLTIQSSDGLADLPDVVSGPLFLNGASGRLVWKEKRRVKVLGDVQITGAVSIEDVELIAAGEVKCFDDARLRNVSVFCLNRFIVKDRAVFSGNVLTLASVLVCKFGRIEDRSVIVAYGENRPLSADSARKKIQIPLSVYLIQNAWVDGSIIACGSPGGVRIDQGVVVKGIVWAAGAVVHDGTLYGILRANNLTDLGTMMARSKVKQGPTVSSPTNTLTGTIRRYPPVTEYFCPFFMGTFCVIRWEEG